MQGGHSAGSGFIQAETRGTEAGGVLSRNSLIGFNLHTLSLHPPDPDELQVLHKHLLKE